MRLKFLLFLLGCIAGFSVTPPSGRAPFPPLISGDAFRAFADHAYDELDVSLDPSRVQSGDAIFVKGAFLKEFFEQIHPRLKVGYILISHNSDESVPGSFAPFLEDERLMGWFGINHDGYAHPKMHPIPIGLANRYCPFGDLDTLLQIKAEEIPKRHLVCMNFTIHSYSPERWGVFKLFAYAPFCYRTGKKPFGDYLSDVAASNFAISPRGFGLDTYRLWECLYVGTIPIVKSSSLDSLYEGLPVLIIPDWEEVTEPFLQEKLQEMKQKSFSLEKLEMNYWIQQIEAVRTQKNQFVTYELSGGRFGDNLLAYLHAKWIAFKRNLPLKYQPFEYSSELVLDERESQETPIGSTPLVIPYFPDNLWEIEHGCDRNQNPWTFFAVDWSNRAFQQEIRKLIAPKQKLDLIIPPSTAVSVAIHYREGGTYDAPPVIKDLPMKFPPLQFYIDSLTQVIEQFPHQPIYCYLFTDALHPSFLVNRLEQALPPNSHVTFSCRKKGNHWTTNVLEDFFSLFHFDILIRPQSNFSYLASILHDYALVFSPETFSSSFRSVKIEKIEIKASKPLLKQIQDRLCL